MEAMVWPALFNQYLHQVNTKITLSALRETDSSEWISNLALQHETDSLSQNPHSARLLNLLHQIIEHLGYRRQVLPSLLAFPYRQQCMIRFAL